jgi:hypothetical protein
MRIIVVGDRLGEAGRDAMSNALTHQPEVGWWHWFPDAWLIRDPQARSPEWWLRLFRECVPTGRILVLGDGPDHPWAAQGPPEFFSPWIAQFWRPD